MSPERWGWGPSALQNVGAPRAVNNASGPREHRAGVAAGGDTDMTGTYVKVIIVEAAILIALFVFGRLFS